MDVKTIVEEICLSQKLGTVTGSLDGNGSAWAVSSPSGDLVIKVRHPELLKEQPRISRLETILNEVECLKALKEHGASDLFVASGQLGDAQWLAMRRVHGTPSNQVGQAIRRSKKVREFKDVQVDFVDLFKVLSTAVKAIQSAGYLHGDIQPAHFILDWRGLSTQTRKCEVIDFELGRAIGDVSLTYPGGLIHFVSPRIASAMLKGEQTYYAEEDELYALCGTLFWLYTGYSVHSYGSKDYPSIDFEAKVLATSMDRRMSFADVGAPDWSGLESLLGSGLDGQINLDTFRDGLDSLI